MGLTDRFRQVFIKALFKAESLAFLFLLPAFTGCNTDIEIVLPQAPPKLVISSFISPENPRVEVSVTKSAALVSPENNKSLNIITNATVWLSDKTDSVQLSLFKDTLYTASNFPIVAGKTYYLRVTAPGGFAASASCLVPAKINQSLTARIDSSDVTPDNPEGFYRLALRWQDLPGEGDYYRVQAVAATGEAGSPIITNRQNLNFLDEPQVRDLGSDGRTWEITTDAIFQYSTLRDDGTLKYYDTYLLTADRAYYEFHKSLFQYQLTNSFIDPIKLYSNVSGGLGIFGAYRLYNVQVPLK